MRPSHFNPPLSTWRYCECNGREERAHMGCGHSTFNCEAVCHGDVVPTMDPVDVGCVAWRATAGCDPEHGARVPR
jgi:hypothetical protein